MDEITNPVKYIPALGTLMTIIYYSRYIFQINVVKIRFSSICMHLKQDGLGILAADFADVFGIITSACLYRFKFD